MLRKLSEEVRFAYDRAAALDDQAAHAPTEETRNALLTLQRSWLRFARSYEFVERLNTFTRHNRTKLEALRARVPEVRCPKCRASMRLSVISPHARFVNLDERAYECLCGEQIAVAVAR